jgi:hypothetical protein
VTGQPFIDLPPGARLYPLGESGEQIQSIYRFMVVVDGAEQVPVVDGNAMVAPTVRFDDGEEYVWFAPRFEEILERRRFEAPEDKV